MKYHSFARLETLMAITLLACCALTGSDNHQPTVVQAAPLIPGLEAADETVIDPSVFLEVSCAQIDATLRLDENVTCGYLTVPEFHTIKNGNTIQLAVMILKSDGASPPLEPLIMAQGGPGGSTIDYYAELMRNSEIRQQRDIILFDQRGTLHSKPNLDCPEIMAVTLEVIEQDLEPDVLDAKYLQATQACHDRLVAEGINLSAFNSLENAADIESLRLALGYDQVNLYGVSYGTLLALHALRQYPMSFRSVILDAVVPPQTNFITEAPRSTQRAFQALFRACAAEPACSKDYPDLENTFYETVQRLELEPGVMRVIDLQTGKAYYAVVDGEFLMGALFQMMYPTSILPALPRMIHDASKGDFKFLGAIQQQIIFDRTTSYGMYYSVICAEDADYTLDQALFRELPAQLADVKRRELKNIQQVCAGWDVTYLGSQIDEAVVSDSPVLVLSGSLDPITPPEFGRTAAATLKNSYMIEFPGTGHGALGSGTCQDKVIADFLNNPNQKPQPDCLAFFASQPFLTSHTLIQFGLIFQLLQLEPLAWAGTGLYLLCLLWMGTALLVYPLAWLGRKFSSQKNQLEPSMEGNRKGILQRLSSWLVIGNTLSQASFLAALSMAIMEMIQTNNVMIYFGLPASSWSIFVFPLAATLFSLFMLVALPGVWLSRHWPAWRQIYFTSLTLSALVAVALMGVSGALTALIR